VALAQAVCVPRRRPPGEDPPPRGEGSEGRRLRLLCVPKRVRGQREARGAVQDPPRYLSPMQAPVRRRDTIPLRPQDAGVLQAGHPPYSGLFQTNFSTKKVMKKKILVLNYRSICAKRAGGAEIYIYEILKNLSTKFEVQFISCSNKTCNNKLKNEHIICSSEFLFPVLSLVRGLKSVIDADIIIESESKMPLIWPLLIGKLLRKKFILIIYHIHGFTLFKELPLPIALILFIYEVLSLKFYSFFKIKIITISTTTFYDLINLGFKESNIYIVPPGLPSYYYDHYGNIKKSSYPLVIYVGRIVKYKRLDHFVRACLIVKQKLPNLKCVIAGKGDSHTYASLQALIKQLNLSDTVVLWENISEHEKIKLLKTAWVYVFPTMKEGFGISALEAQAVGTPVVAYKVLGVTDSVKNGITGILVEDGNIIELANSIIKILQDEDLRRRLSARAMLWARRFEWKVISKRFEEILNQIISYP